MNKCKCGKRLWAHNKDGYCPNCRPFPKCIDCGKTLKRWKTTRCPKCARTLNGKNKDNKGVNNPRYIDGRTNKAYYCKDCGKKLKSYGKRCIGCAAKTRKRNHRQDCNCFPCQVKRGATKGKNNPMYGVRRFGSANPNWIENKVYIEYPLEWNKTFKEEIRKRDNYTCQECGILEEDCKTKLHVHHIDYDKKNLEKDNLISLCHNCHAKTTVRKKNKRMFWINRYTRVGVA